MSGPDVQVPQIGAGLGDAAAFRARMLALLPLIAVEPGDGRGRGRPLAAFTERAGSDPTIALIDAAAALADIVSFYQDRILNEGYLPNAVEHRSLALMARSLGEQPAAFVGATVEVAVFAQPGGPVLVPAGAAIQASPPKAAAGAQATTSLAPVFETVADLTARPELNRRTPLQTQASRVCSAATAFVLAGTGLGLSAGDPLLLIRSGRGPAEWIRLTVHTATENAVLRTTTVSIGAAGVGALWEAQNRNALTPLGPDERLSLEAMDLSCRPFGYNAAPWATQPGPVRRAATPAWTVPGAYADWPGFALDTAALDLQAAYPKLLPGSRFLTETPGARTLGTVETAVPVMVARFGLSGQATHVTVGDIAGGGPAPAPPAPQVITVPGPVFGEPDVVAPLGSVGLADGTILILGVRMVPAEAGAHGLSARAWTFDPRTLMATPTGPPAQPRFGASLTLLANGTVLVAGGTGDPFDSPTGSFTCREDAEIYDPRRQSFQPIHATMSVPRWGHSATLLPDGGVLLAGGFGRAVPFGMRFPFLPVGASAAATDGADVFRPATQTFEPVAGGLPMATALHAATSLPNGDVLVTGGLAFTVWGGIAVDHGAIAGAAIYDAEHGRFSVLPPLDRPRARHTATLRPDGTVLVAGGTGDPDHADPDTASTTTIFSPLPPAFAPGPGLARPRSSHGAAVVPDGVLLVGGAAEPSCEIVGASPAGGTVLPLGLPLPGPAYPTVARPVAPRVVPITVGGYGIYAFGGDAVRAQAALYVEPPPPGSDDRRRCLIFTRSRPLTLARPLDTRPVCGRTVVLSGLGAGLAPFQRLLIAGKPPLARTVGAVAVVGCGEVLPAGSLVMVLALVAGARPGRTWWQAESPGGNLLTLETGPATAALPRGRFAFLCGEGGADGTVTPAEARSFVRPLAGESITVRSLAALTRIEATALGLPVPLRRLYDRTTTTLYGNVVAATEGATVQAEVLGSGDGKTAFQSFGLMRAPLTFLPDPEEGIAPVLSVTVDGNAWARVETLGACGSGERAYQLIRDAHGRARIQFGDGRHGMRPASGQDNVVATYRIGAGTVGNVPAGALTRPPARVGGIKGVLNPLPGAGGIGSPSRNHLRRRIPLSVRGLGRIVTQADILAFVEQQPEVARAVLATLPNWTTLVTLAGPDNAAPDPDSPAFLDLTDAVAAAMAGPLRVRLLPVTPVLFKLRGTAEIGPAVDIDALRATLRRTLDAACGTGILGFGQAVRLEAIAARIAAVPGIAPASVAITDLWIPARTGPRRDAILPAAPAQAVDAAAPGDIPSHFSASASASATAAYRGAEILALSRDADAVALALTRRPPDARS